MAKSKKFLLEKTNVMVCNSSSILFVLLGIFTFIEYRYAVKGRAFSDDIPYDLLTTHEIVNIIPIIGYKIRAINADQVIHNTTQLYYDLERLRYVRQTFNSDAGGFSLLSTRVQGGGKSKRQSAASAAAAASGGMNNMLDVSTNELGLGFNILHLHIGDNIPTLEDEQSKLDEYIHNIYDYFRVESNDFITQLYSYQTDQIVDYAVLYYLYISIKLFLMYTSVSHLNKLKISFEEYSRSKRGLLPVILFILLLFSNGFQFVYFHDYSMNTQSTVSLATTLINRSTDLTYAIGFLFETIYAQSPKFGDIPDVMHYFNQRIDKNEDKISSFIRGNSNQLSHHFDIFKEEVQRLQNDFDCQFYYSFSFDLEDCDDFCPTKLHMYNKQKEEISQDGFNDEDSHPMICEYSKSNNDLNNNSDNIVGISPSVKYLKNKLKNIKEEWNQHLLNMRQDLSKEEKQLQVFQFMYNQFLGIPYNVSHNIRLHNNYLVKLLCYSYKQYQSYLDDYLYVSIFADLAISIVFYFFWIFYYTHLIKGLNVHKSEFEEVNPTPE